MSNIQELILRVYKQGILDELAHNKVNVYKQN